MSSNPHEQNSTKEDNILKQSCDEVYFRNSASLTMLYHEQIANQPDGKRKLLLKLFVISFANHYSLTLTLKPISRLLRKL